MYNIKIKDIEVYHPNQVVSNDFYYEHFDKQNKDMRHYLEDVMGRDKRYIINNDEDNSITMSVKAAKKLLQKNNLKGSNIDMIVFSSQLPEYVSPPASIYLHHEIQGKHECVCYDINVNCAGMTIALENISKYMCMSENINNVLLVGCDYVNSLLDKDNELMYGNYGDAACAVLLEKTKEERGVISSKYYINSVEYNNILFPKHGFPKFIKGESRDLMKWEPFNGSQCAYIGIDNIKLLLEENHLDKNSIAMYCFSQFAYKNIQIIRKGLNIDESKSLYIGDKYAYTGTSSPFIVLYEALKQNKIKRGDYIIFWTIGAGSENISMLFKY